MSLSRQSRDEKKWLAARRAQHRLKQRFETIDFEEDVIAPELDALKAGKVKLEIEASSATAASSIINMTITEADDEAGTDGEGTSVDSPSDPSS